ncbi:uncharacterized protein N0V89_005194 [Didymosphaeria variabile]|uniref:Uncharacterized protein n=1 Tax=Didymosphaeria variabile TaxID=1932322 RepID=A0A9W9CB21_9PLEO|nr:uncharacterized protein N0V89_005194 [Didymosphaeria variabile]KAJ4353465.1 hypothetical protein N0V89_005194 [Didymosphaeria variabile]
MRFLLLSVLCTTIDAMALGQLFEDDNTADVKPFDYDGARQSLKLTKPGLAEIAGGSGGFWGCWLTKWDGGCHWPPHDGCQNVALENDEHEAAISIASVSNILTDDGRRGVDYTWALYNTKTGQNAVCGQFNPNGPDIHGILADQNPITARDDLKQNPPFPSGTLRFQFDGEWCQYKSQDEQNLGRLFCFSLPDEGVACEADPKKGDPSAVTPCGPDGNTFDHHEVVMCNW